MAREMMTLVWKGDAVKDAMRAAALKGVNKTLADTVTHAKNNHPWKNRRVELETRIAVQSYAAPQGEGVAGSWGVSGAKQALALELGAIIRPVKAKALAIPQPDGSVRFAKQVTIPAYPYLRPAADTVYPNLGGNIRAAYEAGSGSSGASDRG